MSGETRAGSTSPRVFDPANPRLRFGRLDPIAPTERPRRRRNWNAYRLTD